MSVKYLKILELISVDQDLSDPGCVHVQRSKPPQDSEPVQPLLRPQVSQAEGRTNQGKAFS